MSEVGIFQTRYGPMMGLTGDFYVTRSLQVYGEYCLDEARALAQLISPGDTVIEVGANMGTHTVGMAQLCAPGLLYAFEPQHRVFQMLCGNLAMNGIGNVRAYPEACGAAGWASVPQVNYGQVGNFGGVSVMAADGPGSGQTVRMTALDDLPLDSCRLIKVDVEGWEAEVLRGAAQTIARFRPILYVENDRPAKQQELISLIDGMGYRQYWHLPRLFSRDNFNGATEDIFGDVASLNMLCLPVETPDTVQGLELIDPRNWTSPIGKRS